MPAWNQIPGNFAWIVDLHLRNISDNSEQINYYATGSVTVDGNDYDNLIDENGISFGYDPLDRLGGIEALKGNASVNIINLSGESDILRTHVLESLTIRLLSIEGSDQELLTFFDGPIRSRGFNTKFWKISAVDRSETLFHTWPTRVVMLDDFPLAHLSVLGHPYPVNFGDLRKVPNIGEGNTIRLAPCIPIDGGVFGRFHCGFGNSFGYELYELIQGRTWVQVIDKSEVQYNSDDTDDESGAVTREIVSSTRRRYSTIGPSAIGNFQSDFRILGDGRYDTYIEDINNLHVYLSNEENLGTITSQKVVVKIKDPSPDDLVIKLRKLNSSGEQEDFGEDFVRTDVFIDSYYQYEYDIPSDDRTWDLGIFSVFMDLRKGANIAFIQVETIFIRSDLSTQEFPNVWMPVSGIPYHESIVNGSLDNGGYSLLQRINNPVFQCLIILRGKDMLNIPLKYIDEQSFLDAALLRTGWKFGFTVTRQQDKGQSLLNNIQKQSGIWLYWNREGKIACKAQSKNLNPVRAFFLDHMTGEDGNFACDRTPRSKLYNYINLRFDLDSGRNIHNNNKVKSAVFRQNGTNGSIEVSGSQYYFETADPDDELLISETGQTEIYTLSGKRLRTTGPATNSNRRVPVSFVSGDESTEVKFFLVAWRYDRSRCHEVFPFSGFYPDFRRRAA